MQPRISRRLIERSEWSLEFYVDAANTYRMHCDAKKFYQEFTTVEEWSSGPLEKRITKVVLSDPRSVPDKVGTLKITSVKPLGLRSFRALVMSTDPQIEVLKSTQVETYYRGARSPTSTNPPQSLGLTASLVIRQWQNASWSTPYRGTFSGPNEARPYIYNDIKWLQIDAEWDLRRAR